MPGPVRDLSSYDVETLGKIAEGVRIYAMNKPFHMHGLCSYLYHSLGLDVNVYDIIADCRVYFFGQWTYESFGLQPVGNGYARGPSYVCADPGPQPLRIIFAEELADLLDAYIASRPL